MAFAYATADEAEQITPQVVLVDENNRLKRKPQSN